MALVAVENHRDEEQQRQEAIRARMDATGEPCIVARRHIGRPTEQDGLGQPSSPAQPVGNPASQIGVKMLETTGTGS
jgi:hypothetical protein